MRWAVRASLGTVGVLAVGHGVLLLTDLGEQNLLAAIIWLTAGVVLHDGVIVPITLVVAVALSLVPLNSRAPLASGLVILATVSLVAIPVLGRFGARADNPTLLDRNYLVGWLVFAALVVGFTAAEVWRQHRSGSREDNPRGTRPRRR